MSRSPLVIITNHGHADRAIALKRRFAACTDVQCFDSGSALTEDQAREFDLTLGNVYYGGLFNRAAELAIAADRTLLFIASDVRIRHPERLFGHVERVLADETIGVYGPSSSGAYQLECSNHRTQGLRDVTLVDGYCFAVRPSILKRLWPVSDVNRVGWGIDAACAYYAQVEGLRVAIDDRVLVYHRIGHGYDSDEGWHQMQAWLQAMPPGITERLRRRYDLEARPTARREEFLRRRERWYRVERLLSQPEFAPRRHVRR